MIALSIGLAASAAIVIGFFVVVLGVGRNGVDRVESEHSISVPDSVSEIEALGDASGFLKLVQLDRGASTILVFDRSDLPEFLDQFSWEADDEFVALWNTGNSPAPGNSRYQPSSVPWGADAAPESRQCSTDPPGTADFVCVWTYTVDDADSVGIWIYSDWN